LIKYPLKQIRFKTKDDNGFGYNQGDFGHTSKYRQHGYHPIGIGGEGMLLFLAGLFCGSFVTIIIMSLMFAAKKGDQYLEEYLEENYNEQDDKKEL
jgi:hypothetical protein